MAMTWSIEEARRYQLYAVGLRGGAYAPGAPGIRACFRDLGGIQLDPLPVLGRNHDLVVQARVDGTHPGETLALIHEERLGFEYWDKVLCAIAIEEYPWFSALMRAGGDTYGQRREARLEREHPGIIECVHHAVDARGPLSSRELKALDVGRAPHRAWKANTAANGALEALWNRGVLSVAHREAYRRYFDLTTRVIPEALRSARPIPLEAFQRHLLLRRVRMTGLLPARGDAEAWAFLRNVRSDGLPQRLVACGELALIEVDGIDTPFYAAGDAQERLERAQDAKPPALPRFIAPLDPLLWARTALSRLWAFDYTWEVYKPRAKRRYGYYVLPVLWDARFVGRFDGRYDRASRTLSVLSYHEEKNGLRLSDSLLRAAFRRFLTYLDGERIELPDGGIWEVESLPSGIS